MTTLFPDFMDTALLAEIAKGDVGALQASMAALQARLDALQAAPVPPPVPPAPSPTALPAEDAV